MGQVQCQCLTIHPTPLHRVWCCPLQWPVHRSDFEELYLLHHMHLHLHDCRHGCWSGEDITEVSVVGKLCPRAEFAHHVYCVSGSLESVREENNTDDPRCSMGVAAHSEPNYQTAMASYSIPKGPVLTYDGTPPGTTFVAALDGPRPSHLFLRRLNDVLRIHVRDTQSYRFLERADLRTNNLYACYVTFGMITYSFQG